MKQKPGIMKRGFTLIELLVVVGILSIVSVAVVGVINPAQLFSQARDAERLADLNALKTAITLYLGTIKDGLGDCLLGGTVTSDPSLEMLTLGIFSTDPALISDDQEVDSTGWIDINFIPIPTGPPLAVLPIDPINSDTYFYGYACNDADKTFELVANMESPRYASSGSSDVESTDGGDRSHLFEAGSKLTL